MLTATELRAGHVIRIDDKICKVLFQEMRGTGKFGRTVFLKLKDLEDGHNLEKSVRAEDKLDDVDTKTVKMQYLYKEKDAFVFMNSDNYEQFSLPAKAVGKQEIFLRENTEINVLFAGDRPLSVDFPKSVELKVTSAPPGIKGQSDTTYKEVELENGLKILAPQFVKEGESIRVQVEDLTYLERVTTKSMKQGPRSHGE